MGEEINFLASVPKIVRDVGARSVAKERNRQIALAFGQEYFDGSREQGYGGYTYDGRWQAVAARLIEHYGLDANSRVLDVGCAKGFLVKDLGDACPGLDAWGLDISAYALAEAPREVANRLVRGDCRTLPFADSTFDLVLAINTVHNLSPGPCGEALREIARVSRDAAFVQVDAYRNDDERALFEDWMLTARTWLRPDEWRAFFAQSGYDGDYFWTILQTDGTTV